VLEVEEGDSDDAGLSAETQLVACLTHLTAPVGSRPARTRRRGRLRDHVVGASLEDEVKILVRLVPDERHGGIDAEDMALEGKPCRRQWCWSLVGDQLRDRDRVDTEKARTVLQGLHLPVLDAAGERSRVAEVAGVRWRGDAGYDERDPDDSGDGDSAHTHETGTTGDDIETPMLPPRHGKRFWGLGQD
jgi:hypothetical protein